VTRSSLLRHIQYETTVLLFFSRAGAPRPLHSFPTRRSSDLFFPREPKPPIDVRLLVRQQNAAAPATGQHPPSTIFGVALHARFRSEEHTSELQSRSDLVCRLLLEKKKTANPLDQRDNAIVNE